MTKLQKLWIQNTRVTEQGVQRLLALPGLNEMALSQVQYRKPSRSGQCWQALEQRRMTLIAESVTTAT
jgi:hypothetical protein